MSWAQTPVRLHPDNFTPPSRTPWGGRRILERYKNHLPLTPERARQAVVGESWEVSVEPTFPSRCPDLEGAPTLAELLASDPEGWLGARAQRDQRSTPLLVKLLDAADNLSVQIHPADDYAGLAEGESGKPECWYILDAREGAGLYLGLAAEVTRDRLEAALRGGEDLRPHLNFAPVQRGDCFVIEPGTVHAIGAGVTLLEPQLVRPGRTGKTYRFWDWNRRYDARGARDLDGAPRQLHVSDSLAVTDFDAARGADFVATTRGRTRTLRRGDGVEHAHLAALQGMNIERLRGSGRLEVPGRRSLTAVSVVGGRVELRAGQSTTRAMIGESLVMPASMGSATFTLHDAEVILVSMSLDAA